MILPHGVIRAHGICLSERTVKWCRLPYPGHPKGCPKYGLKGCPPDAPPIGKLMRMDRSIYIAYSTFNLHARICEV